MKKKGVLLVSMFLFLIILSGCETTSPIAEFDSVTCLFTDTVTEETAGYGTIIIEFNTTTVTLMTEGGIDSYATQEQLEDYIDAKSSGDHYHFIENRVTGFEELGYTCIYE